MRPREYLLLIALVTVICTDVFGQSAKIEILKKKLSKAANETEKLTAIFSLCEETETLNKDSLAFYAKEAKRMAVKQNNTSAIHRASYYEAYGFFRKNLLDSALLILNDQLPKLENEQPGSDLYARFNLLKGRYLVRKQEFKDALSLYYRILNNAEKNKDTLNQMKAMAGVGSVLNRTGDKPGALSWFLNGIHLSSRPVYRNQTIYLYTNTAVLYNTFDKYDSSVYYVQKAIQYAREAENYTDLTNSLGMYAGQMIDSKKFPEAERSLREALEISEKMGDPNDILTNMGTLGVFYSDTKQPQKGIDICLKAVAMIRQYHAGNKLPFIYDALARNYEVAGKYKQQGETLQMLVDLNDSLYQQNSAEAMSELRTKFDVQKKENTIILQQLDLVKKDYFIYSVVLLFLLALLVSYIVFATYKKRQKQKAAMAIASAEETERKRIAADLHDNLGAYAASIASNVNRLTGIGGQDVSVLQEVRNNSNAIVADLSDTIWALKKEALPLTAVSDRLKVFIQRVQASYPDIIIDVNEELETDHLLSPSQGFHLFQTIQEAVNNALKHSGGTHIVINIKGQPDEWKITIADDGRGMQPIKENSEGGNGLFNMKNRAGEAGWNIEWEANVPSGTVVVISS